MDPHPSTIASRLQHYLIAQVPGPTARIGPFTLALDSEDDAREKNVAIPHDVPTAAVSAWLPILIAAFADRTRLPTIQWSDAFAPHLAGELAVAGFAGDGDETLMICTPSTLINHLSVVDEGGYEFVALTEESSLAAVRENLDTNERGFDPGSIASTTDAQAAAFRATLVGARAFTLRVGDQATTAGMYTIPRGGVTEVTGIATIEPFRGRGFAAALTAHMADAAFAAGCDLVFLRTTNRIAQHAYERAGFAPCGQLLLWTQQAMFSRA